MTDHKSETPIIDAAELDNSNFSDWGTGPSGYVPAEVARQLERSRNAAVALLRGAIEDAEHFDVPLNERGKAIQALRRR